MIACSLTSNRAVIGWRAKKQILHLPLLLFIASSSFYPPNRDRNTAIAFSSVPSLIVGGKVGWPVRIGDEQELWKNTTDRNLAYHQE